MKNKIVIAIIFIVCLGSIAALFYESLSIEQKEATLIFTDSSEVFRLPSGGVATAMITVVDSADTKIDSVFCSIRTGTSELIWSPIVVHDINQAVLTTNVDRMIPGDGATRTYQLVGTFPILDVKLVRSNTGTDNAYQPRTRVIVSYLH